MFGAWISSRAQKKREIVAELHALRAAHALCFSIANKALTIKKQHIGSMKREFDAAAAAYIAHQGNLTETLAIHLDLQSLYLTSFPTAALEKIVFEKCFLGGRGIATTVELSSATEDLRLSIDLRNQLVAEFRTNAPASDEQKIQFYLGVPGEGGRDERLKDNVNALFLQANDCIFFGRQLGDRILESENQLRSRNNWKYRLPGRKLKPVNWAIAEKENLIPPDSDYKNWTKGFVKDPSASERIRHWFLLSLTRQKPGAITKNSKCRATSHKT